MSRPARVRAGARCARGARGRGAAVLLASLVAACSVAAPASGATRARRSGVALPGIPLAAALSSGGSTWAEVAMGRLSEPLDTFWQLLVLPAGSSRWRVVTPPGVADNGGLVSTTAPGTPLLAGFETSVDLRFSPLARSSDSGRSWTPGLLPSALARVPDALAVASGGRTLALVGARSGGGVEESTGSLSSWRELATARSVAAGPGGRTCGLDGLTAVAWEPSGSAAVGARCRSAGRVGILLASSRGWTLATTRLRGAVGRSSTEVLRLAGSAGGVEALVAAASGGRTWLVGSTGTRSGGPYRYSPVLELRAGGRLSSSAALPGGGFAVTIARGPSTVVEVLPGREGPWRRLPDAPSGTAVVAGAPGGRLDALSVHGSRLVDYVLARGGRSWRRAQELTVLIPYGSSR